MRSGEMPDALAHLLAVEARPAGCLQVLLDQHRSTLPPIITTTLMTTMAASLLRHSQRCCLRQPHPQAAAARRLVAACCNALASDAAPYVSHLVQRAEEVPVPLCRRPAAHVEPLAALLQWRAGVLEQLAATRDGFVADGGPSRAELQREVTWVLDDVVAAWRQQEQQAWALCSWQQLDLEVTSAARHKRSTDGWQVQLRAPLAQLRPLWELRLQERVPFQYLLHTAHWSDLVLAVGPGVLVPRPETEGLLSLSADALAAAPHLAAAQWADLGTGSGAIAIGLARLLRRARDSVNSSSSSSSSSSSATSPAAQQQPAVLAVDVSPTALAYASANAASAGVAADIALLAGSWLQPLLAAGVAGRLGGLVSNPPYIPAAEMAGLQPEVGRHEPHGALDGGPGPGLDSLQVIAAGAAELLLPGGFLALETAGGEQAAAVAVMLREQGFVGVAVHDDCFGQPRLVAATRAGGGGGGDG